MLPADIIPNIFPASKSAVNIKSIANNMIRIYIAERDNIPVIKIIIDLIPVLVHPSPFFIVQNIINIRPFIQPRAFKTGCLLCTQRCNGILPIH